MAGVLRRALLIVLFASCSDAATDGDPTEDAGEIRRRGCDPSRGAALEETTELGEWKETGFELLTGSSTVVLVRGTQGGVHIEGGVSFYADSGSNWVHRVRLLDVATNREVGGTSYPTPGCAPGWSTEQVRFFSRTATSSAIVIELETILLDEAETPVRTLVDRADVWMSAP
jgi:hypothetical protein